jgi:hypothetical protein
VRVLPASCILGDSRFHARLGMYRNCVCAEIFSLAVLPEFFSSTRRCAELIRFSR